MKGPRHNFDENRARLWFESQGYSDIRRPSDDPPDFVVDGCVAAEVRRLIYPEGELTIPLENAVRKVLAKLGPPTDGKTVFLSFRYPFSLELPKVKVVEAEIGEALESDACLEGAYFPLDCGIRLRAHPPIPSPPECNKFELNGAYVGPPRWGGVGDLVENISRCIDEKSRKVKKKNRLHDYPCWWLLLIDHIHYVPTLSEDQLKTLREQVQSRDFWKRIIVISPESPKSSYEL